MSCEKYKTESINENDCIGDSLDTINNNFFVLRNAYCDIRTELNNRLRIMNQSVPLPEYTETIVFSGTRVSVRVTPGDDPYDTSDTVYENGIHKTVFIPVTGVTQIIPGSNITIESTEPEGKGIVTVNFELPPRPKQVRTFIFNEDGNNNAFSRPSYTRLQTFINNRLKIGSAENIPITTNSFSNDVSRENDEIYVVYFKTARNSVTLADAGSTTYTGYKANKTRGPVYSGGEPGRPSSESITSNGAASYTMSWPSDTAERSVLVTITYKFRFTGTEYVPILNDDTGAWPKYSYSLHQAPSTPSLQVQVPADTVPATPDVTESVIRYYGIPADPFIVPAGVTSIELLVVGGGGGGGVSTDGSASGGGGAGGYYYNPTFAVRPGGVYFVNVGAGGRPGTNDPQQYGGNSEFSLAPSFTNKTVNDQVFCRGGGAGGNGQNSGGPGASGGGAGDTRPGRIPVPAGGGILLNNPFLALPYNVAQGNGGAAGAGGRGGGGGGFGGPGQAPTASAGGLGGPGILVGTGFSGVPRLLTGRFVCAGGSGGGVTYSGTTYTQPADPRDNVSYGEEFKYGNGGGAGKFGSNGIVGVAYDIVS